jgi:hypothetical protein
MAVEHLPLRVRHLVIADFIVPRMPHFCLIGLALKERREARRIVIDAAIFVFGTKYACYPRVSRGELR